MTTLDTLPAEGKVTLSGLNLTTLDPIETEPLAYEEFASKYSVTAYREILADLYVRWHEWNAKFFEGRLRIPHIGIGQTPSRRFSLCRLTTNYGGKMEITLRASNKMPCLASGSQLV